MIVEQFQMSGCYNMPCMALNGLLCKYLLRQG